jgi:hypothetical protein
MKPHKHATFIKAWADGAEIEYYSKELGCWQEIGDRCTSWNQYTQYRIKPKPVIKKMYMHYDSIEGRVHNQVWDGMQVPQQMFFTNSAMSDHIEFTFTDGKLTSVKMMEGKD